MGGREGFFTQNPYRCPLRVGTQGWQSPFLAEEAPRRTVERNDIFLFLCLRGSVPSRCLGSLSIPTCGLGLEVGWRGQGVTQVMWPGPQNPPGGSRAWWVGTSSALLSASLRRLHLDTFGIPPPFAETSRVQEWKAEVDPL
jgi:hypothetical protein